jgi:hypothetical protein
MPGGVSSAAGLIEKPDPPTKGRTRYERTERDRDRLYLILMMGRSGLVEEPFQRLPGSRSALVVQPSYSDRTGQLQAFLECRRAALVDIGGEVDQMNTALSFLTRLDSHNR